MTLTGTTFCFLLAALIFGLNFLFGFFAPADTWGRWRIDSAAFMLIAIGLLLHAGGK